MKKIILASISPRRKELLEKAGFVFDIVPSEYEEEMDLRLTPSGLAKYLSMKKAMKVAARYNDAVVIAADTFIVHEDRILGKPHTPEVAREMLRSLSGKEHSVVTGFTVAHLEKCKLVSHTSETRVKMKPLSEEIIESYIATGEPLDKAGAYAIQGGGGELVEAISGDLSTVIGLPVDDVLKTLQEEFCFFEKGNES